MCRSSVKSTSDLQSIEGAEVRNQSHHKQDKSHKVAIVSATYRREKPRNPQKRRKVGQKYEIGPKTEYVK